MTKGERRRQQIIETAESLFYEKGYEATSIQDILDEMNLSKGGFYHHFESKLQLLAAICELRAGDSVQGMEAAVRDCTGNAVDKLNALFSKGGLLHGEQMDFVGLMIRVAYQGDGVLLREKMKEATVQGALPLINAIIREGTHQKLLYTRYPDDIGELLLSMFTNLTDQIAQILATNPALLTDVLSKLEVYRSSMELLLNAPYGSLVLFDLHQIAEVLKAVAEQGKKLEENQE